MRRYLIVRVDSYEGEDTHIRCGDEAGSQRHLYCVVASDVDEHAQIVDSGYRTYAEAAAAWPEAAVANSK